MIGQNASLRIIDRGPTFYSFLAGIFVSSGVNLMTGAVYQEFPVKTSVVLGLISGLLQLSAAVFGFMLAADYESAKRQAEIMVGGIARTLQERNENPLEYVELRYQELIKKRSYRLVRLTFAMLASFVLSLLLLTIGFSSTATLPEHPPSPAVAHVEPSRSECYLGVKGTKASLTIKGPLAGQVCRDIVSRRPWFLFQMYQLDSPPSESIECQPEIASYQYIVRDTGTIRLAGPLLCEAIQSDPPVKFQ